jgi:YceI-like protein
MSARVGTIASMAAVCGIGLCVRAQAQDAAPRFTISGTSTVRAWSCPAQGALKITPGKSSPPLPGFPKGVQSATLTVPVKAIDCEEEQMREHLREALKEASYAQIVYELVEYTMTGPDAARATGKMTIAGVTRPIDFDVKLVPSAQGVRTVGETSIDMTEFNVVPPVIFQGLLKVGKDVRIRFDAVLPPQ